MCTARRLEDLVVGGRHCVQCTCEVPFCIAPRSRSTMCCRHKVRECYSAVEALSVPPDLRRFAAQPCSSLVSHVDFPGVLESCSQACNGVAPRAQKLAPAAGRACEWQLRRRSSPEIGVGGLLAGRSRACVEGALLHAVRPTAGFYSTYRVLSYRGEPQTGAFLFPLWFRFVSVLFSLCLLLPRCRRRHRGARKQSRVKTEKKRKQRGKKRLIK